VTFTVWTGQVNDVVVELLVEPPLPEVVAVVLTMSAVEPNLSPYTVLGAIVPVAAAVELMEPVVTVDVVYFEFDDAPKVGPTTTSRTAPTPTTISAIAANLAFIHPFLSCQRQVVRAPDEAAGVRCGPEQVIADLHLSSFLGEACGSITTQPELSRSASRRRSTKQTLGFLREPAAQYRAINLRRPRRAPRAPSVRGAQG
jgi:hypothetical protein